MNQVITNTITTSSKPHQPQYFYRLYQEMTSDGAIREVWFGNRHTGDTWTTEYVINPI